MVSKSRVNFIAHEHETDSSLTIYLAATPITVNCVAPGLIHTPGTSSYREKTIDRIVSGIPMGRMGEITDIANAVLFLASDESKFITREVIHVSGGVIGL